MHYARNPEVLWRSTSRGAVLLPPGDDQPERLGGLAAVVWEVLDAPMSRGDVAGLVLAIFEGVHGIDDALAALEAARLVVTTQ